MHSYCKLESLHVFGWPKCDGWCDLESLAPSSHRQFGGGTRFSVGTHRLTETQRLDSVHDALG